MICEIGGMVVRFEVTDAKLRGELHRACAIFFSTAPEELTISVLERTADSVFPDSVELRADERGYDARTQEFITSVDICARSGFVFLRQASASCFTKALKNLAYYFVLKSGGVVLHASAVVKNSQAYIFIGPSGSGKSTIARLSSDCAVLSQESIAIIPCNHVAMRDRNMVAVALPYEEDAEFSLRASACENIAALFTLVQDQRVYLEPVTKAQALARTLMAGHPDFENVCPNGQRMAVMEALCDEVPCYELHFRPDATFWRCIDERFAEVPC